MFNMHFRYLTIYIMCMHIHKNIKLHPSFLVFGVHAHKTINSKKALIPITFALDWHISFEGHILNSEHYHKFIQTQAHLHRFQYDKSGLILSSKHFFEQNRWRVHNIKKDTPPPPPGPFLLSSSLVIALVSYALKVTIKKQLYNKELWGQAL